MDAETEKIEQEAKEKFYKKTKNEAYKKHMEKVLTERAERDAKELAESRWGDRPLLHGITKLIPKMSEDQKKAGTGILGGFANFYKNLSEGEMLVIAKRQKPIESHASINNTYDDIVPQEDEFDVTLVKKMRKQGVKDMSDLL